MPIDPSIDPIFDIAGPTYGVPPALLRAVAGVETGGEANPATAVSPKGAQGLMQLMPDTAKELGVTDPNDPIQSIFGGAKYLSQGFEKYGGDQTKALMYYHGGPDEAKWGELTQAYPGKVAAKLNPPAQVAQNAAQPLTGTDALAASGGAKPAPKMSDDDLMSGFINGTLPSMQQRAAPAASTGGAGFRPEDVARAQQSAKTAAILGEPLPEFTKELSLSGPGFSANPQYQNQMAVNKAAGEKRQIVDPISGAINPAPGSTQADEATAAATARGQASEKIEITRDGAIYKGSTYVGHAPKLTTVTDAQGNQYPAFTPPIGQVAPGMATPPGVPGATADTGFPPPPAGAVTSSPEKMGQGGIKSLEEASEIAEKTFGQHQDAYIANQPSMQNLRNYLDAASKVGTGRGTTFSADTAAWLKSWNIDPEKLAMADPAQVQIMQKAAGQMVQSTVRGLTSKPAYADFGLVAQSLPDPEKQPEANKQIASALLGRMDWENQLFKAWNADKRANGMSAKHFDPTAWIEDHPMPAFQAHAYEMTPEIPQRGLIPGKTENAPQFKEGQTATNPTSGARVIFRGGQWVPAQ